MKRAVAEVLRGSVMPYESQVWREEPLQIPPVAASRLAHCTLMDIWYNLYVSVGMSGFLHTVHLDSSLQEHVPFRNKIHKLHGSVIIHMVSYIEVSTRMCHPVTAVSILFDPPISAPLVSVFRLSISFLILSLFSF
jgi:hypothetical protein